ncbi:MAG: PAS domain-containing protein [Proteobacteria bacterium]|nr:PAS domain-containing protein [Pseudomonadota bacterium]
MDTKLRRLADYFLSVRDAAAVDPKDIDPALLPHIFILDIERSDAAPRLRVRMTGTEIGHLFGRALEGGYMEKFLHGPRGGDVIAGFHDCADTHVPVWMRQVVRLPQKAPRFVEGVAVYLEPDRIYGGLVVGEVSRETAIASFERENLAPPA